MEHLCDVNVGANRRQIRGDKSICKTTWNNVEQQITSSFNVYN